MDQVGGAGVALAAVTGSPASAVALALATQENGHPEGQRCHGQVAHPG